MISARRSWAVLAGFATMTACGGGGAYGPPVGECAVVVVIDGVSARVGDHNCSLGRVDREYVRGRPALRVHSCPALRR